MKKARATWTKVLAIAETAYSLTGIRFAEFLRSIKIACDLYEHEAIFFKV